MNYYSLRNIDIFGYEVYFNELVILNRQKVKFSQIFIRIDEANML